MGCLDSTIKDPLKIPKVKSYGIKYATEIHELINFGRVKYLKGDINYSKVIKNIINDKPISHENEIKAWTFYYSKIFYTFKFPLEKTIYKIQKYRNKRITLEKNSDLNIKNILNLWTRFKHFEMIFGVDLSYRAMMIEQQNTSLMKIIRNLNNNIHDLKKKYLKK